MRGRSGADVAIGVVLTGEWRARSTGLRRLAMHAPQWPELLRRRSDEGGEGLSAFEPLKHADRKGTPSKPILRGVRQKVTVEELMAGSHQRNTPIKSAKASVRMMMQRSVRFAARRGSHNHGRPGCASSRHVEAQLHP